MKAWKIDKNNRKFCLNQESYEKTELLFCSLIIAFSIIICTKELSSLVNYDNSLYIPNMRKYLANAVKRINKVSVDVQKVYLGKTVIQETKSKWTCNSKYVWYMEKLENTAQTIGSIFVNFHRPFNCLACKIEFGIW